MIAAAVAAQAPREHKAEHNLQPLKTVAQQHIAGNIVHLPSGEVLMLSMKVLRTAEGQTVCLV
jgi:hypothetical protein